MEEVDKQSIMSPESLNEKQFVADIRQIIIDGKQNAYHAINIAMVKTYWAIGQRIVEQEQLGKSRAEYGRHLLQMLSKELSNEFGKGFSTKSLYYYRQFYSTFDGKFPALWGILSWSHYKRLLSVADEQARMWYLKKASEQMWSARTLDRNISTQYYYRLLQSQKKEPVEKEMVEKTETFQKDKFEFIKSPIVAEFLGLSSNIDFTETELESCILSHLQKFLMEMGKGFAFIARQQLIVTETEDYYIDLVFYNYILKCFVLVDLKTSKITHQDVGQMDMYVRMYDEMKRAENDNPTLGLILCAETNPDIARYSILHDSTQLFAAKYLTCIPSEEVLLKEIEQQKEFFRQQYGGKEI